MLFFILFYLALLSMSSLPVWRDEQALYAHERRAGAYGDAAYFGAVVLCDLLLVRTLPPLSFVFVSYRWIGLKRVCSASSVLVRSSRRARAAAVFRRRG